METSEVEEPIVEKKKLGIIPKIIFIVIILIILIVCYAHYIEPSIITYHEEPIIDANIPESFDGFKIVQFSDIHYGRTTSEQEMDSLISEINQTKPDIVVFTGDLLDPSINLNDTNISYLKEKLSQITYNIGKYAIKGDSDYTDETTYESIMQESGFTLLNNKDIPVYYHGTIPIYLSGIPSISKEEPDITKALTKEEGTFYQMVLIHEPILFSELASSANLVLAGHSLGGLIRLNTGLIKKNNVGNYEYGKYTSDTSTLYVSNGIGTEDIDFRFLNIPSFTLYRLYHE